MDMLKGRTAILLGASSGVGYGAALKFAEEGANVVAGARRLQKLEALRDDAKRRGFPGEIIPVACDIEKEKDLDHILAVCIEKYGKVDILACIAQGALNDMRSFEETDLENLLAFYRGGPGYTLQMIQKCLPYMKKEHYGRIITCASGAGERYTPHSCAYGMAKAAIINLTRVCAQELGKYGVVTNCFLPVITNDYFEQESNDAAIPVPIMNMLSPVGKLGGAYQDGSPMVTFLASEQAGYINGQVISVCGGISYTNPATILEGLSKMKE